MSGLRIVAGAAVAAWLSLPLLPGEAFSQACQCIVASPADGTPVGRIAMLEGDVRISEKLDYIPARSGEALTTGRRILVGQGTAEVLLGSECSIAMRPNTSLTLIPAEQGICAALEMQIEPITQAATTTGSKSSALAAGALAVGGLAGIVAIAVSSGGGDSNDGNGVSN